MAENSNLNIRKEGKYTNIYVGNVLRASLSEADNELLVYGDGETPVGRFPLRPDEDAA